MIEKNYVLIGIKNNFLGKNHVWKIDYFKPIM